MLAETFINPLNLPNLLTPFRYNLEIQYVVFSILFVSLLGYVLFAFLDYMGFLDKMFVLIGVFIVLLFLFLVIKERDRLDEIRLQEEVNDMSTELKKIDEDVKLNDFLIEQARDGITYDKYNKEQQGKPDLARVKNLQMKNNKLLTKKKEIEEKRKGYDKEFLEETDKFVTHSAASELKAIEKENEILNKKIKFSVEKGMQELGSLSEKEKSLSEDLSKLEKSLKNKDKLSEQDIYARESKKREKIIELRKVKEEMKSIQEQPETRISAKDRVKLDKARKKFDQNNLRTNELAGLDGTEENKHFILRRYKDKGDDIKKKEKQIDKARENLIKAERNLELFGDTDSKEKMIKAKEKLEKEETEFDDNYGEIIRRNTGNEASIRASNLIDIYDNSLSDSALTTRSKQLGVYQKLQKLDREADDVSRLAGTSAEIVEAVKDGKSYQQSRESIASSVMKNLPPESKLTYDDVLGLLKVGEGNNLGDIAAQATSIVKASKNKPNKYRSKDDFDINFRLKYLRNAKNTYDPLGREDVGKLLIEQVTGKLDDGPTLYNAAKKSKLTPREAERKARNFVLPSNKRKVLDRLADEVNDDSGELKPTYQVLQNRKADNLRENLDQFQEIKDKVGLPAVETLSVQARIAALAGRPAVPDEVGANADVNIASDEASLYEGYGAGYKKGYFQKGDGTKIDLQEFKNLVDLTLDQLNENTPENLTLEQKQAKKDLLVQKQWLDNHQDIIIQRAT